MEYPFGDHPGTIYAYETNGLTGSSAERVLMDDANIPSLLAMPFFDYVGPNDGERWQMYLRTREFVLSSVGKTPLPDNPPITKAGDKPPSGDWYYYTKDSSVNNLPDRSF